MAMAISSARKKGAWVSGVNITEHTKNVSFPGFSQWLETDSCGKWLSNYVVLDTDGHGSQLFPTHLLDMSLEDVTSLGQDIHFPSGAPPKADCSCWFDPDVLCTGGKKNKILWSNVIRPTLLIYFIFFFSYSVWLSTKLDLPKEKRPSPRNSHEDDWSSHLL